jgi:hypothetical protein
MHTRVICALQISNKPISFKNSQTAEQKDRILKYDQTSIGRRLSDAKEKILAALPDLPSFFMIPPSSPTQPHSTYDPKTSD